MTKLTVQSLEGALRDCEALMIASGDHTRAKQVQELGGKLTEGRLTVALCGHFSAGKSTLVNKLCGAKLLPSSPIPTSANVVSIRGGEAAVAEVVIEKDGATARAEAPIDQLERYCVDGERFVSVSIVYPSELLGNHTVLLDTPGIDSTDGAHRLATESALHLADVVFYVMDYNHVQSEINFTFAKELKDWGKPLYFIVNQIDKHRERELPFQAYRQSVEEAFRAWDLEPAGILYLSLRQPDHPYHEWDALLETMSRLKDQRTELCAFSVDASLRHIAEQHVKWAEAQNEPERNRLLQAAGGEEEARRAAEEANRLAAQIRELESGRDSFGSVLRTELQPLLDNANITPAALRDLAQSFLESRKPGFKAGLLFASAKTAAEQERRLEAFRSELNALIGAGIEWHAKSLLRGAAGGIGYNGERLEAEMAEALSWQPDGAYLLRHIKPGAVFGPEYTMTYCKEVSAAIKAEFRRRAMELIERLSAFASSEGDTAARQAKEELAGLERQTSALQAAAALDRQTEALRERLRSMLPDMPEPPVLPAPRRKESPAAEPERAAEERFGAADGGRPQLQSRPEDGSRKTGSGRGLTAVIGRDGETASALIRQRQAAARLEAAAERLSVEPLLAGAAASMRDKAERLKEGKFTIALFGAFSAGKSSLANALIGEPVLPVSPNPTTAAINRLLAPDERYGHGTARIVMKSRQAMMADLRYSLALLGDDASEEALPDAAAVMAAVDRLSPGAIGPGGRPHYSFLRAARTGWDSQEKLLGTVFAVEAADYARYVADEARSCFVSEIDYHYSCPLTEEGIVLVDTPGADSINARHTGVAFNYIKNADAVLFVTYYNHAFSQADRQFLDQLGRVKDQFELDKMFFIVNAADLAADEEELQGVLKHVESNLLQHGIRFPRLFPVSSLQALDGKADGDEELLARSGIEAFEASFLGFVQQDLGRLAAEGAEQEIRRAISIVGNWLKSAEGDAQSREEALRRLEGAEGQARTAARELSECEPAAELEQEISELMYYIVQRMQYRFGDFYNIAFNPASLNREAGDLKRALWTCWLELQRMISLELSQELLATSLRIERRLHELLRKPYDGCEERISGLLDGYGALPYAAASPDAPPEPPSWKEDGVDAKRLWASFKNPRQFFEGGGKAELRKELESAVTGSVQGWMSAVKSEWLVHYERAWRKAAAGCASALERDMDSYLEGKRLSLRDDAYLEKLSRLHAELNAL